MRSLSATESPALARVVLQLKWQHQFQFAGYYAAAARGYYKEAGLEVEMREAVPGKDPVEEVLAGHAHYGVGTSELVLLRGQGKPVVVLAAIFQHSPLVLLVPQSAGVTDLHGLAEKPIMIEPQSAELLAYFKHEGIDPAKLKIVHHTFSVDDLVSGRVAAMSAYSTDEPFQLRQAGRGFLTFTPRAGGIDFYGDNLFTTESEIARNPERARAFRAASLRGWDYALAHPEEIIDLIVANYSQRKSREHLLFEARETAKLMHPQLIQAGHMNPGRWEHIAQAYRDFGMLQGPLPLGAFLYGEKKPDQRWLYWSLAGASVLAIAGLGWALPLLRQNRRLRRSERELRQLAENAPFPVAITDRETSNVIFANRRSGEVLGESVESLIGEPALRFYENPADRSRLLRELEAGQGLVSGLEVQMRRRDGRPLWAMVSAGLIEFGGREGLMIAFYDITERRAAEDELRRAKESAEAADAAKARYLGVLSHEVRTPLNGILGMVDMLKLEPLSGEARDNVDILDGAGRTLLKLVEDLLDFARYDTGRVALERESVVLADFLRELVALFRPGAEAKALALRYAIRPEVPATLFTDPLRLRQVLSNLLGNAIKFTTEGSVELTVEVVPALVGKPLRLRFHVSDTGIGIAADRLAQIFEPYVQADQSVSRRYGGSGLGLSISKRLAQLLGGSIHVQSAPGAGSLFTLEIEAGTAAVVE